MLAFITGSGLYQHQNLQTELVDTPYGSATLQRGTIKGKEVLMLSRHGEGHHNLPHHINHRANIQALKNAGATAIISCSVCGILNPEWSLGKPLLCTDIYFPENRLGDGSTCSLFQTPGEAGRGHLLAGSLLHSALTQAIGKIAGDAHQGCYGNVLGPRFNTITEIKALQQIGVDFISQTCGPEAVLANEAELPYSLAAFGIDYANGVVASPTPLELLQANLEQSQNWFLKLIEELTETDETWSYENFIYRFDG
ncbi:MTAP family purine nucleoside phosphorylase [Kiritimatiellota bacterium B12222]|nr:MTAP family purine nucleoside phosphorylase [Kiritimatiellota bacterium B12222]